MNEARTTRCTRDEAVAALAAGRRRFYDLGEFDADEAAAIRREALEKMTGASLSTVGSYALDGQRASTRHCENFIGAAQVPMGVVGPLPVRGRIVDRSVFVPMATTEAALVASTNRGCAALRQAGGVVVHVEDAGMTRAPVFRTRGVRETQMFLRWLTDNEDRIRDVAESTSQYLKLREIRPFVLGSSVFLRFNFDSGDAMGMNMSTIAVDTIVHRLIEPETGVECVAISGNYCVDKKPAAVNFLEGRGKRIFAEVVLDRHVLRRYLKTTPEAFVEVQYRKNLLGSIAAGAMGFNAHYANMLAAVFIATGQDIAQVVEGSMGVTCIEPRGEDSVYASVFLPDVPLGVVGGGTALDTQREALSLLGLHVNPDRPGDAATGLAEIVGAVVLAGELSLLAAFTSNDLARAHERLARGSSSITAETHGLHDE